VKKGWEQKTVQRNKKGPLQQGARVRQNVEGQGIDGSKFSISLCEVIASGSSGKPERY